MRASTPINKHNVYSFLRRFAKHIRQEDLEVIPKNGSSLTFYYGKDHILKVNKPKSRPDLVKEARLAAYLNAQQLPIAFAEPVDIHPQGYFAVFERLTAQPLTARTLTELTPTQMDEFTRFLGTFLSFLHTHAFPDDIRSLIPRSPGDLAIDLKRAERALAYIHEHAALDTREWEAGVDRLRESLNQTWAVTHSDVTFGNILMGSGKGDRPAIIDFAESEVCDPSVDFAYFAEDLQDEGVPHEPILNAIFDNYDTNDTQIRQKAEFKRLTREIVRAFRNIRSSVRRSDTVSR